MITKYAIEKSLLFDGFEGEALAGSFELNTHIEAGGPVRIADFAGNRFEDLKGTIDSADYKAILKTGNFTIDEGFLHLLKGSSGLGLFFCKRNDAILVFAFGETQPMRYKLYLEGVWVVV
ncbi:hypothetical protein F0919_17065 [Taibaiella lutea]|uniref:Uncharacterized protein n=1 Tax=Taibaiella lutea TaxID=2608001 RepID=A0A5M6CGC6_9BACT|nr:hypothetical protein [Taibaiella lutea]KAA5532495.1 hypothetical protein F0919_17065 [Taibaiella lutea]